MTIADTDVLIDFLAGRGLADLVASELDRGTLCTTVVTRFELLCGARTHKQETVFRQLLQSLDCAPGLIFVRSASRLP